MKKIILIRLLVGALALCAMGGIGGWYFEHKRVATLESRLTELEKEELRSAVDKSVSEQMSVIASQQKDIAEEKREEALKEKQRADEAFQRSEEERRKALEAEHEAKLEKEKADMERMKADEARRNAEASERVARYERNKADTLRYISLGRSLGSASRQALLSNQQDIAQLLAYYSYYYTKEYGGELYIPDVFQALLNASHSVQSWAKHRSSIRGLDFMQDENVLVSVCDYGTILRHKKSAKLHMTELRTDTLFSDKQYDFRYLYAGYKGIVYAVSRSGHLVVLDTNLNKERIIRVLENDHPSMCWVYNDNTVIVVGEQKMALVDLNVPDEHAVKEQKALGFRVTSTSHFEGHMLLFDDAHRQHVVIDINNIQTSKVPVPGKVTAFYSSKQMKAYGMEDGTIYLLKDDGSTPIKLLGHEWRISELKIDKNRLYSSSYDGRVIFWPVNNEKIEPMELISKYCWIHDFTTTDSKRYLLIGDQHGNITQVLMDVKMMNDILEKELQQKHRDFTRDEWDYYIGKNTKYAPLIMKGKEVKQ